MKKLLLLFSLFAAVSLVACGGPEGEESAVDYSASADETLCGPAAAPSCIEGYTCTSATSAAKLFYRSLDACQQARTTGVCQSTSACMFTWKAPSGCPYCFKK